MSRKNLKSFTAAVVLLATFINNLLAQDSSANVILENFMKFNGIPTTIPLGLLSESQDIEDIELVNGTCFQYRLHSFNRCKYYSDCCLMTSAKPMEQLAYNTFSCHDNFYIVDKCPQETPNKELKALCEDFSSTESDLSLKRWPVRGLVNHLTYKNVFCAMCNGIDPQASVQFSDQIWFGDPKKINDSVSTIEWWPAKVECDTEAIEEYLSSDTDHRSLITLVKESCKTLYLPPESPDLCWDAVRTCPTNSNRELKTLCEKGPVNYINITSLDLVYRNQFCALCHGVDLLLTDIDLPQLPKLNALTLELFWDKKSNKLKIKQDLLFLDESKTLMFARPTMFNLTELSNNFTNFKINEDFECSFFADQTASYCEERVTQLNNSSGTNTTTVPVWNLGSMACFSNIKKICDRFLIPQVVSDESCTEPGCGFGHVFDPETLQCYDLNTYGSVSNIVTDNSDLQWHSHSVCAYQSQCKAVDLGIKKEQELNCYCDKYCMYFNDCCEDSSYQPTKQTVLEVGTFSCVYDRSELRSGADAEGYSWGIMQVEACPKSYNNSEIKDLCENPLKDEKLSYQNVPVSSLDTGLRYSNVYCAICNDVKDIHYWRVDVGCIHVANDKCNYALGSFSEEILFLSNTIFRKNPNVTELKHSKCKIKQYLPPLELIDSVRRCKFDAANYVASCPEHAEHWKIADMCSNGPASFVYDGGKLASLVKKSYSFPVTYIGTSYGTSILSYGQKKKYRNSYCASCNGVAWLGCDAKPNNVVTGTSEYAFDRWLRYEKDVMKFLFIYEIDLNERTCNMNSDAVLLYSDFNTTLDTCLNISHHLKQCNCSSILDLDSETCIPTPFVNDKCRENRYEPETFKVTNHGINHCGNNFEYLPLSTKSAFDKCFQCFINLTSDDCQREYEQFTGSPDVVANSVNSVHCAVTHLIRCNVSDIEDSYCAADYGQFGLSSGTFGEKITPKLSLLNSLAISYQSTEFNFEVYLEKSASLGVELLFSTFNNDSLNSQCVEYSLTSNQTSWLICRNSELQRSSDQTHYDDYLLWNDEIRVCTETAVPEFVLATHDYVFSSLSILFILIYVVYYFTKLKKTVTGNFVVSSMITLMFGLVFYCLINETESFTSCRIIASCTQYFLIAVHTWTNAVGILMIKGISSFKLASQSSWKKYAYYAAYAWLTPLIFVIIAYSVDAAKPPTLYPVFSDQICFVARGWIRLLVFTGPIYLLVVVNITMCIIASVIVLRSGNNIAVDDKQRTLKKVITIVKLQVIFGFEWFLLLFTEIKGPHQTGLWIALNVFMTLQGVTAVLAQLVTTANIRKGKKWFNSKVRNHSLKNSQSASNKTAETEFH